MSWVTDVLLLFSLDEVMIVDTATETCEEIPSAGLAAVNEWLESRGYTRLVKLTDSISRGSGKAFQAEAHGGAFNFLDIQGFVQCVQAQRWRAPENVQLLLKDEQEPRFTVYQFADRHLIPLGNLTPSS